jgi:hypothetical protein
MELGAGIELATAAFPQLFLPMACIANVVKVCPTDLLQLATGSCYSMLLIFLTCLAKWVMKCILLVWCIFSYQNVAAVTSTSTRTPIYKAYAKGENIGDVTAKGESVGNIADLVCVHVFHWTCSFLCCCRSCFSLNLQLSLLLPLCYYHIMLFQSLPFFPSLI